MIKTLKIEKIARKRENKQGEKYIDKNGKPFELVYIKTKEGWISLFARPEMDNWQENDEVEIIVEQKGQYLNGRIPTRLDRLEIRMDELEAFVKGDQGKATPDVDVPPDFELPF